MFPALVSTCVLWFEHLWTFGIKTDNSEKPSAHTQKRYTDTQKRTDSGELIIILSYYDDLHMIVI